MSRARAAAHLKRFWPDREQRRFVWNVGPMREAMPGFRVCRVSPADATEPWAFVTLGASEIETGRDHGVEFLLLASRPDPVHIETLTMIAHYHLCESLELKLDVRHTLNIGRPWIPGATCDRLLLTSPIVFGPRFEWSRRRDGRRLRFVWLLPITAAEHDFVRRNGIAALERLFEEHAIDVIDPSRASVV